MDPATGSCGWVGLCGPQAEEPMAVPGCAGHRLGDLRHKIDLDVGNAGRMKRNRDVAPTHLDRLLLAFPEIV